MYTYQIKLFYNDLGQILKYFRFMGLTPIKWIKINNRNNKYLYKTRRYLNVLMLIILLEILFNIIKEMQIILKNSV